MLTKHVSSESLRQHKDQATNDPDGTSKKYFELQAIGNIGQAEAEKFNNKIGIVRKIFRIS